VAQFCFLDSRELVPTLPGDVLLIFAEGSDSFYNGHTVYDIQWGTGLAFEWASSRDDPLMSADELPRVRWHARPCYGVIHRTSDYANVDHARFHKSVLDAPPITEGTKIGGLCPWTNEPDHCRLDTEIDTPGTYLCTLASITFGGPSSILPGPLTTDLHTDG